MTSFIADKFQGMGKSALRKIFESAPPGAINFGIGEIQFPTPTLFLNEAARVLQEENIRYTANAGLQSTRKAVARYYEDIIEDDNVCLTVGAEEAVYATLKAILNLGDEILIPDPAFVAYDTIVGLLGGKTVRFNLNPATDFSIDFADLENKISSQTKALILSNPSNPLGKSLKDYDLDNLISICRKHNLLIICDEVYRELFVDTRPASMLEKYEHSIVISSLSKSHCMSGWRIGWAVSKNRQIMQAITVAHQYISTCASYLSQRVATLALSPSGLWEVDKIRQKLNQNRTIILTKLASTSANIIANDASPYIFVKTSVDDYDLTMKFINCGLIVMPGSIFGKNSKGWIRINYGLQKPDLEKGIKLLCRGFEDIK